MKSLFSCLVLFLGLVGCQKTEEVVESQMIAVPAIEDSTAEAADYDNNNSASIKFAASMKNDASFEKTPSEPVQKIGEAKIIKTGDLRFQTDDLQATYDKTNASVKKHAALIQNDNEGKNYECLYRKITVRVPSQNFDSFLTDISNGVNYFDKKEISSQDVTEDYIDVDARLKAKKVLEARYLELLKKANKVSEMLEIETQLSAIREEIEAKEGQLRYMQSSVSMSTITIEFYKTIPAETGVTASYGTKIWNAIKSGFNGISSFFIGLLQLWPFILILVGTIYFIKKRFKRKTL